MIGCWGEDSGESVAGGGTRDDEVGEGVGIAIGALEVEEDVAAEDSDVDGTSASGAEADEDRDGIAREADGEGAVINDGLAVAAGFHVLM